MKQCCFLIIEEKILSTESNEKRVHIERKEIYQVWNSGGVGNIRWLMFTKCLKRVYIEGKEIGIKCETVLFFDRGKNIVNREQWKTCAHRKERNIGIEYETVMALATFDDWGY